ncbi:GNAT family N-acetyltransferase [Rhizobiales bacterium RZME27]|uniref:GNAT family N-acetyltransferase n=1 Tax=Endobacterium cereale TaxID=2663029 RepID=A0A6A8A2N5_9HYPH|nr:GNAT family N-acetyltransferase [Endobacterium cereale]MEB2845027.1 GNAT family N-acetyltransferase [Endobacterium cereale]MQY44939.1 GNAT family N-acetyltransferase [Endobacterium cereale]
MTEIIRIENGFQRWDELFALILSSFAYMDGVIDPPSSANRLTLAALAYKAQTEVAYVAIEAGKLVGCVFCKPEERFLYIGKLAIAPSLQGNGLGRKLLAKAEEVAREKGLPALRLETRIELVGNHATFGRWGFEKTAENRHAGFDRTTSIEMQKRLA